MMAMGQTMATYSGQNFGKGDVKRIRQGVKSSPSILYRLFHCSSNSCVSPFGKPALGLFFTEM